MAREKVDRGDIFERANNGIMGAANMNLTAEEEDFM